jgi:hypothetical protein
MIPNVKPSQMYPNAGAGNGVFPQSLAAAAAVTGPYVQVPPGAKWAIVRLLTGALGAGSEQVDVLQAQSAAGLNAKALATNIRTSAVNNQQFDDEVNIDLSLDINNGFNFIAVKVTNTGGTGALVAVNFAFGPNEFLG